MVQRNLDDFIRIDSSEDDDDAFHVEDNKYIDRNIIDIDGIKVKFPFKPYECQEGIIRNIISGLEGSQQINSLLESPTGSGKSMAILCGVLGWLEHAKRRSSEALEQLKLREKNADRILGLGQDEDFIALSSPPPNTKRAKLINENDENATTKEDLKMPKIYITSRTHRQIAQLIEELHRTSYNPKFVVLGSRQHYCINTTIRNAPDINESCRDATSNPKTPGCTFYNNVSKHVKNNAQKTPDCDIEDLVKRGKKHKYCPYFVSRMAMEDAEIIFAPYNYLVDPMVREAVGIQLDGDIVIIDEAHNIEDVSRESGSFECTDNVFAVLQQELNKIISALSQNLSDPNSNQMHRSHGLQAHIVAILGNWLKATTDHERGMLRRDFESKTVIWSGQEMVDELSNLGINYDSIQNWRRELENIIEASNEKEEGDHPFLERDERFLSFGSCQILKGLYHSLANILSDGNKFLSSYRMVKYQTSKMERNVKVVVTTLGFWCLNPEVIFRDLVEHTKSVILTSGTLSPMKSFSSELGTKFQNTLEANHVIDKDQSWIGVVPMGPNGCEFLGNYQNMNSFAYQDDLAQAIKSVTDIVSGGVLCFLPSYSFLFKLTSRMKDIGVWSGIEETKEIFLEPRQGKPKDFDKLLQKYYEKIRLQSKESLKCQHNGALLFAVYRGKISEGLDLKDDNCRAVIPIGIPFPAFKDPKVVLKREFNDAEMKSRNLMNGQQWYQTQAFRALNQALGRCIRHQSDWGAIVLFEKRFLQNGNVNMLSKWVRNRVETFQCFSSAMGSLKTFISKNALKK